jgi:hypothetical protein
MSVLVIVLIALAVLVALFFIGGLAYSRRRLMDPALEQHIQAADQALEAARANDRGWDRALLEQAARRHLESAHPGFTPRDLHLVLVDDRPGMEEDRAHMLAMGDDGQHRIILTRDPAGEWILDRIE